MEPEQVKALCVAIQSPTCIILGTQAQQRLFFQDVSEVKLHLSDNNISSGWVQAVQYLIRHVEGKQVEYTVTQKRKTFSYGRVLVNGSDVIAEMLSRGLLKLGSDVKGLTDLEKQAQTAKIGLWNDRRVSLNSLSEAQAKRSYLDPSADIVKRCYVERVEGLKMFLIDLDTLEEFVWYMSQLQIPRMNGLDPRKAFVTTEDYIKDKLGKAILKCRVRGCEIYKGEVSLYGVVCAGQSNLVQELVRAGYAELSKNAEDILGSGVYKEMVTLQKQAKLKGYGFFKKRIDKDPANTTGLNISNKMKQYEFWIKEERRASSLKNPSEQLSDILGNYKIDAKEQLTDGKMKRIRTLSQVCAGLLTGSNDKYREELKEFYRITCGLFWQLSGQLVINVDSTQYIKLINALLRSIIACMNQTSEKQNLADVQKLMRTVFRLVFIGNNIFHSKIFQKQKEVQFQNFSFDNCDFSSSSMSEVSDDQRPDREHVKKKRLNDAYLKVRISSSLLVHLMLKLMPNLMETNWELIVKPNIFEKQFTDFVNSLSFKAQVPALKSQEKEKIVNLMRINFGEHSLLSMLIFQTNPKIKANILKTLQLFTCTYQGRKIIQTIEFAKFEKEIKQTKSFIPKSFLVFSAYRNLYHTLLFCLYYERDPEIKVLFFKALMNIIEHTSILEKIPFQQGLKFLLDNFILPILGTDDPRADELRLTAVECLSKIVSVKGRLEQFQSEYLCGSLDNNILRRLIGVLKACNSTAEEEDQMLRQIYNFFTQIVINHLEPFVAVVNQESYWELFQRSSDTKSEGFAKVIQEICKEINSTDVEDQNQTRQACESRQVEGFKKTFLQEYLPKYLQQCQNLNSPTSLINRINIFCQLRSDIWSNPLYQKPSLFLLEIFKRLGSDLIKLENQEQSPNVALRFEDMRNNPYVKVAYLRLVGYLSFIEKFRTDQIAKHVFRTILSSIKSAKGLNTLTKCSWALSSWSGYPNLSNILTQEEVNQVFSRLIEFARSDKEKIASHGARGLGLFASTVANKGSLVQFWIDEIKDTLITNMKNKSPKVSWNCLVSLRMIMKVPNLRCQDLIGGRLIESLIYNFSRSNFKLQLQTIQTLKCLPQQQYIHKYSLEVSKGIMNVLQETNKQEFTEYSFAEFKYVDTLRREVVRYFVALLAKLNDAQKLKSIILKIDLYLLLTSVYKHLLSICVREQQPQKGSYIEQKGKQKGEQTEKEVFNVKTKRVFDEEQVVSNVQLLGYQKITLKKRQDDHFFMQLKLVSSKVKELIEQDQSLRVNFSVVEGFQQLAHMRISQTRVEANLFQL